MDLVVKCFSKEYNYIVVNFIIIFLIMNYFILSNVTFIIF